MITSVFSKSKPINYIIVFAITLFAVLLAYILVVKQPFSAALFGNFMLRLALSYFSILVLNFIVTKNQLSKSNNYQIFLFSLFLLLIPQTTTNVDVLLSNLFILFGLRRLISLRSQRNEKSKLFDAGFWFAIAALFYFWAILFFVVVFAALLFYRDNKLRNWIIPFTGVASVFIITVCVSIVLHNEYLYYFQNLPEISEDFSSYNTPRFFVGITLLLSYTVWSIIFYLNAIKDKKRDVRPSFYIILITLLVAIVILFFSPFKNGSEFLFVMAPLAIIIAAYLETIKDKWFREAFVGLLILMPIVLLFL
ncbi:DUF6427 family protein [Gaetbulibacter aestuarii]|uniref:DUF6427 family protein n=1 Tax=Gaetbulibacter aestuarii TaxID=1502358 RepID=A0ABW7MUQ4_9FLAO